MEDLRLENPPEKALTVRTLQLHASTAYPRNCFKMLKIRSSRGTGRTGRLECKEP